MVFARYFDDGREGSLVGVHLVPYPVGDLCGSKLAIWDVLGPIRAILPLSPRCGVPRLAEEMGHRSVPGGNEWLAVHVG